MKRIRPGRCARLVLLPAVLFISLYFTLSLQTEAYAQEKDIPSEEDSAFEDEILLGDHLIMPETLLQRIQAKEKDFILFDLRKPSQYAQGHVKYAQQCPWGNGDFKRKSAGFPLDKDIIVISGNGGDGIKAVLFLLAGGFTRVFSVEGGMENWLYKEYLER